MSAMRLSLRAGERVFVNGAVLRVERKTVIELLNDATFLLEQHVMQVEDATTPLRQLYFVVQTMLVDPDAAADCRRMATDSLDRLGESFQDADVLAGLDRTGGLLRAGRTVEALKAIRALIPLEDAILAGGRPAVAAE